MNNNMQNQSSASNSLAMMAMQEIPVPNANAKKITALIKNSGRIVGYQLEDGQLLSKEAAISLARQGGISGVGIARRKSSEYLKALPDGQEGNNLGSLPTISQSSISQPLS